ncbi:MAG: PAS domain-containing protein [Chromatiales bacterium]|jgi:PAS domain S-box-containing protein
MKKHNITPTDKEIVLDEDSFIISKTDLKGKITYCNRVFSHIAGYEEAELLGQPHNIVRHPDMPRTVFAMLWDSLKAGDEFFGYVKNMAKNGDYYWVAATASQVYEADGSIAGYYSVRRKPSAEALAVIIPLYAEMKAIEEQHKGRDAIEAATQFLLEKLGKTSYEEFAFSL